MSCWYAALEAWGRGVLGDAGGEEEEAEEEEQVPEVSFGVKLAAMGLA